MKRVHLQTARTERGLPMDVERARKVDRLELGDELLHRVEEPDAELLEQRVRAGDEVLALVGVHDDRRAVADDRVTRIRAACARLRLRGR
jgi:hypothetical protein